MRVILNQPPRKFKAKSTIFSIGGRGSSQGGPGGGGSGRPRECGSPPPVRTDIRTPCVRHPRAPEFRRTARNRELALERLRREGASITSTETVLFELLKTAADPRFKEIFRLVK
jgi:hypothetical protein